MVWNIGIEGLPGTGKDTLAAHIAEKYGHKILSFARPLKLVVQQIYQFSDAQMFGSSHYRNEPDLRYPRGDGTYLTPRLALQLFGTEAGRACYENTWIDLAAREAAAVNALGGRWAFTDVRFEVPYLRGRGDCKLVRLTRSGVVAGEHASNAHAQIPDSEFDLVLSTDGPVEETRSAFDQWYQGVCDEG